MSILALDLALKTGFAHTDGESGVFELTPKKKGQHNGWRYAEFSGWLADTLANHPSDWIVYESAHQRGRAATMLALGLVATVELVAAREGIETVRGLHSGTVKKHATGNGRASKEEMARAARERNPGRTYIDDNEIDALYLLDLALST